MYKYDSNWLIFDSFTHIINMKGKIMYKEFDVVYVIYLKEIILIIIK